MCRVQSDASLREIEANGFTQFIFIADSGGSRTCEQCKALDGKTFALKDGKIGVNLPPLHPNCRCSIAGHEDDEDFISWLENHGVELTDEDLEAMGLSRKAIPGGLEQSRLDQEGLRNNQTTNNIIFENKTENDNIQLKRGYNHTDHIRDRQRKEQRNISDKAIESVVKNPLHVTNIRYDEKGRPYVKYIGKKITVIVNPFSGARITVIRTTKEDRDKWKKKKRN